VKTKDFTPSATIFQVDVWLHHPLVADPLVDGDWFTRLLMAAPLAWFQAVTL